MQTACNADLVIGKSPFFFYVSRLWYDMGFSAQYPITMEPCDWVVC